MGKKSKKTGGKSKKSKKDRKRDRGKQQTARKRDRDRPTRSGNLFEWADRLEMESSVEDWDLDPAARENRINDLIADLLELTEKIDPLEILTFIASRSYFDAMSDDDFRPPAIESYVEYFQSVVLSRPLPPGVSEPDDLDLPMELYVECLDLIGDIYDEVLGFSALDELMDMSAGREAAFKFAAAQRFMINREPPYPGHQRELIIGLFKPHDKFLAKHTGFSTEQVLAAIEEIRRQRKDQLTADLRGRQAIEALLGLGDRAREERPELAQAGQEELGDAVKSMPEFQQLQTVIEELDEKFLAA